MRAASAPLHFSASVLSSEPKKLEACVPAPRGLGLANKTVKVEKQCALHSSPFPPTCAQAKLLLEFSPISCRSRAGTRVDILRVHVYKAVETVALTKACSVFIHCKAWRMWMWRLISATVVYSI